MSSKIARSEATGGESVRNRCRALTRAGEQCKNHALPDSLYCRVHQAAEAAEEAVGVEVSDQE